MNRSWAAQGLLWVAVAIGLGLSGQAWAEIVYGPYGSTPGNLNAYEYDYLHRTFDYARYNAGTRSLNGTPGRLVKIGSEDVNWLADGLAPGDAWIGLTDHDGTSSIDGFDYSSLGTSEGNFRWMDGSPATFTRWGGGEPNDWGNGEDAAHIRGDGYWNDHNHGGTLGDEDQRLNAVIEYDLNRPSDPAPPGFTSTDINTGRPGSAQFVAPSGTAVVTGGGGDIWGNSDGFHYAYTQLPGDRTVVARVTAQGDTNDWAKAGVMFRAGTGSSDPHAMTVVTPVNQARLQWRDNAGGGSGDAALSGSPNSDAAPLWVGLRRQGNDFTSYWSYDAGGQPLAWVQGPSHNVPGMVSDPLVGLAVTAHDNGRLSTANFDHIDVDAASITPAATLPVTFRADCDDRNTVFLSKVDTEVGGRFTTHNWTNTGTLSTFPFEEDIYFHIVGQEFTGGDWLAASFTAPLNYVWDTTGTRVLSTTADSTKQPGRALWSASPVPWDDPAYVPWDPTASPSGNEPVDRGWD
ncbi:MAG: lectin-like protein, partial [Planctomycetota bacterium]